MAEHDEPTPPIHLPPPTPWPLVLGLGMAMMMAGIIVFLRNTTLPDAQASLGVPILGSVLFFVALGMMLRDDVRSGEGHGH